MERQHRVVRLLESFINKSDHLPSRLQTDPPIPPVSESALHRCGQIIITCSLRCCVKSSHTTILQLLGASTPPIYEVELSGSEPTALGGKSHRNYDLT